jgi:bacillithiol biosynthesis cysteine-adding enzyme BshC
VSTTGLFADYLNAFARVERFYPAGAPFDWAGLAARARVVAGGYPPARRAAMAQALRRQNPGNALAELFAQPGTVAIITGQQVGLFGGPLLSLHKAMTAVLVAERLRARGVAAVPVFWMATQDHDLAEVDHAWLLDSASVPQRISVELPATGGAVGPMPLGPAITETLAAAERCCPGEYLADLRAAYTPTATLGSAFAAVYQKWFAPWNLLTFDPLQAPEADAIWQPYYLAAFDRQPELAARLGARSAELSAAGYHAQVEQTAAASMLFLSDKGRRLGLRRVHERWLIGEEAADAASLRERIAAHPEQVSPAALLRPVLQDAAVPVAAQVTGPAETSYLAQSAVLFDALGVDPPVAWPRARVTLVDAKARRLLTKYNLTVADVRATPAAELLAQRALPPEIEQQTAALQSAFDQGFAPLAASIAQLDPTLSDAAEGAALKIRHQLEQLSLRVGRSLARRSTELASQAQHLDALLAPQRQPQERLLTSAPFSTCLSSLSHSLDPAMPVEQTVEI